MNWQNKLNTSKLYKKILDNKLITICILFTFITILESLLIVTNVFPAKTGKGAYVHMLGRFTLNSLVVGSLYLFEKLKTRMKSKIIIYLVIYIFTITLLLSFVAMNGLFFELHPDAYVDATISYTFMYVVIGIIYFLVNIVKKKNNL